MKISCPECSHEMEVEYVARLDGEHCVSMKLHPAPGGALTLKTVGGVMVNFEKLLDACGKEAGLKSSICVKNLSTDDSGVITITAMIMRIDK